MSYVCNLLEMFVPLVHGRHILSTALLCIAVKIDMIIP